MTVCREFPNEIPDVLEQIARLAVLDKERMLVRTLPYVVQQPPRVVPQFAPRRLRLAAIVAQHLVQDDEICRIGAHC